MKFVPYFLLVTVCVFSCKKQDYNAAPKDSNISRTGGFIEDAPEKIAKVQLLVSDNFIKESRLKQAKLTQEINEISKRGGGHGKPPSPDVTPPTVVISSPASGSNVSGTVLVAVSAADNVGVTSLSFLVNGALQQTVSVSSFSFSWNSDPYAGTTPTLTAMAKDAAGNSNSFIITVSVNAVQPPPPPPPPTFPAVLNLDCPMPMNQGNEGACVPFSVGYGLRDIEYHYRTGTGFYDFSNCISPEYIYNQTKFGDCGSGTSCGTVMALLEDKGACTWASMPFDDTNGCSLMPTAAQDAEAVNYKIPAFTKFIFSDTALIKTLLFNHHPFVFNTSADDSWINAGPGFIWTHYSGSGGLPHAMAIVGWDDTKHAYKVMNSWGTSWGDGGFSYIDYDWFQSCAGYYCYTMNY